MPTSPHTAHEGHAEFDAHKGHEFEQPYWQQHWAGGTSAQHRAPANPYLASETAELSPGQALDAGCGAGAEAVWLAEQGWQVTGVDISGNALDVARAHARRAGMAERLEWVETDLLAWEPARTWDLVVTSYAHAPIPQLDFYRHLSEWVAPGGSLVIVAHADDPAHRHHPREASVTPDSITALFGAPAWQVHTAKEHTRTVDTPAGGTQLQDVVVRVRRMP